ncbi:hypothetical protein BC332_33799 [Capsicum chinense]|nr:hypothetical protein BC332_33799 [Capsicum chinense]
MRPPSACRPAVGASAPKGTCRWLSRRGGRVAVAALKYNFHRAAGRILCRQLKYATGYFKHTISNGLWRKTTASQLDDFRNSECGISAQRSAEDNVGAWRHAAIRAWHRGTMAPRHRGAMAPRHQGTMAPWRHGTKAPRHRGAMAPWRHGTVVPWHRGAMAPWRHGTMAPRHQGTVAPWHQGTKAP